MTEKEMREAARNLLADAHVDGDLLVLDSAQVCEFTDGETMVMVALVVKTEHLRQWGGQWGEGEEERC